MSDFGFPLDAVLYKYLMERFWIICPQGMKG